MIPGVTQEHSFRRRLPGILEALKRTGEKDDRPAKLEALAKEWFDAHAWYIREAKECEAHDQGNHWGYIDERTGMWVGNTLDEDQDRVRITVNVTKAVNDTAGAMLCQDAPIFKSCPGKPGVAPAAANEAASSFLDYAWNFHNLDDLYRQVGRSAFSTGTSFVLLEWDKTIGPLQLVGAQSVAQAPFSLTSPPPAPPSPEMGAAAPAELAEAMTGGGPAETESPSEDAAEALPTQDVQKPEGNLRYRILMRDQVAFDPTSRATGGTDGIGVIVKWRESRTRLMEMLPPEKFNKLNSDTGSRNAQWGGSEERTQRTSPATGASASETKDDEETIDLLVFYLRSRNGRPRGDCIMVGGGQILYEGENDIYPTPEEQEKGESWPSENWPLFTFIADQRENCPWGRSRTVDAIPIQHAINGCYSKALQHIALIANSFYITPAGLDWQPQDEPGGVARVAQRFWSMTNGAPIQMASPPQMPPEYMNVAASLIERLEYATGVNAASLGNTPTSQASGKLTDSLQQRDNTRIAPMKRSHDNQWGRVQDYAMRLFRRNATGKRMLRVIGEDLSVEKRFFDVADLASGTDVYVVNDTSVPRDPMKRVMFYQNVMTMVANAKSEETARMALESIRVPEINEWIQRSSPHQTKAVRCTRLLLLGESDGTQLDPMAFASPPPPNVPIPAPWDNPMIFKAEIERFAASATYLDRVKAEKQDPQNAGKSPLEQRTVWYWTYFAQKVQMAAQPPMAPPGGGAAPPGAPPQAGPPSVSQPGPMKLGKAA